MSKREINLMDLIIEMLLHWRIMLGGILIGAMLLGGFSYWQSYQEVQKQKQLELAKAENEDVENFNLQLLVEQLTEKQIANVEYAIMYEQMYQDKIDYSNNSILMQINPIEVKKAELTFRVSSDDMNKTYNIEKVYEDLVLGNGLAKWIADKYDIPEAALSEVINLERSSNQLLMGGDTFRVSAVHYDEAVCKNISNGITEYINLKYEELLENFGEHEIQLLNQSFAVVTDTNVLTLQRSYLSDIATIQTAFAKIKDEFSDEEQQYYEFMTLGKVEENTGDENVDELNENATEEKVTKITNPQISMKYVALGVVLAVFVYMFVVFFAYVVNDKLRMNDDWNELYNLPQLGEISIKEDKKRLFSRVDKWILGLRNRGKRHFSSEEALKLASVAVKILVEKERLNKICFVGCGLQEQTIETCRKIASALDEYNLNIEILNNLIYDAEAMTYLTEVQAVVLVGEVQSTLYNEIEMELELLKRQEIKVLGGILIN